MLYFVLADQVLYRQAIQEQAKAAKPRTSWLITACSPKQPIFLPKCTTTVSTIQPPLSSAALVHCGAQGGSRSRSSSRSVGTSPGSSILTAVSSRVQGAAANLWAGGMGFLPFAGTEHSAGACERLAQGPVRGRLPSCTESPYT